MADFKLLEDDDAFSNPKKGCGTHPHSLSLILESSSPVMRTFRYLILVLVVILGLVQLRLVIKTLEPPYLYLKDIAQEYLMAKALLTGVNPYLPIPELFERFIGPIPMPLLPHPTPHPPPAALLGFPLSPLTYAQAVQVWLAFELILIFVAVYLLLLWGNGRRTFWTVLAGCGVFLAWRACLDELVVGQLMLLLLVLLLGVGIALRSRQPILAGVFTGLPATAPLAFSFRLLGIGLWQGRLPGAFFALGGCALLYSLASRLYGRRVGVATLGAAYFDVLFYQCICLSFVGKPELDSNIIAQWL